MKRMHIHVGVDDLNQSIRFYTALFDAQPVKTKTDYAKWMLDDPSVNFAISTRSGVTGVDHLGLQAGSEDEMTEIRERLKKADMAVYDEGESTCCYARSDKAWIKDPAGIGWETFQTKQDLQTFSTDEQAEVGAETEAGSATCCSPKAAVEKSAATCC